MFGLRCIRTIVKADVAYSGVLHFLAPEETESWSENQLKDMPCI